MIRAVLDTNVLVAAILSPHGAPAEILGRWRDGEFEIVVSSKLLAELGAVLARPSIAARVPIEEAEEILSVLAEGAVHREDRDPDRPWSRDPKDDFLIELAAVSGAHVLVTGDRDLLEIDPASVPVRTPRMFLGDLEALGPPPSA